MKFENVQHNPEAGVSIGRVDGTREELTALRDGLTRLLDQEGALRETGSEALYTSEDEGLFLTFHGGEPMELDLGGERAGMFFKCAVPKLSTLAIEKMLADAVGPLGLDPQAESELRVKIRALLEVTEIKAVREAARGLPGSPRRNPRPLTPSDRAARDALLHAAREIEGMVQGGRAWTEEQKIASEALFAAARVVRALA